MLQEFKLYALHLGATEEVCLKHVIVAEEFTATVTIEYVGWFCEIVEATDKKEENNTNNQIHLVEKRMNGQHSICYLSIM